MLIIGGPKDGTRVELHEHARDYLVREAEPAAFAAWRPDERARPLGTKLHRYVRTRLTQGVEVLLHEDLSFDDMVGRFVAAYEAAGACARALGR